MAKFEKPPGPDTLFAAVRGDHLFYVDSSREKVEGLPHSFEIVPYVPEWKKDAAEAEYRSLLEAGERQDEAFEDALIAVKVLADALEKAVGPTHFLFAEAAGRAKELAPGAWIIKREEIREAEDG